MGTKFPRINGHVKHVLEQAPLGPYATPKAVVDQFLTFERIEMHLPAARFSTSLTSRMGELPRGFPSFPSAEYPRPAEYFAGVAAALSMELVVSNVYVSTTHDPLKPSLPSILGSGNLAYFRSHAGALVQPHDRSLRVLAAEELKLGLRIPDVAQDGSVTVGLPPVVSLLMRSLQEGRPPAVGEHVKAVARLRPWRMEDLPDYLQVNDRNWNVFQNIIHFNGYLERVGPFFARILDSLPHAQPNAEWPRLAGREIGTLELQTVFAHDPEQVALATLDLAKHAVGEAPIRYYLGREPLSSILDLNLCETPNVAVLRRLANAPWYRGDALVALRKENALRVEELDADPITGYSAVTDMMERMTTSHNPRVSGLDAFLTLEALRGQGSEHARRFLAAIHAGGISLPTR